MARLHSRRGLKASCDSSLPSLGFLTRRLRLLSPARIGEAIGEAAGTEEGAGGAAPTASLDCEGARLATPTEGRPSGGRRVSFKLGGAMHV